MDTANFFWSRRGAAAACWALGVLGCNDPGPAGDNAAETMVPLTVATTTSYQDGALPFVSYAGTRDTMLAEAQATTSFGAATTCRMDNDDPDGSGKRLVVLLDWQTTGIPAGSVVTAANITVRVTDSSTGTFDVYGLTRSWSEASATWQLAQAGTPWATPGAEGAADRNATLLGSFTLPTNGTHTFALNAAGVALMQSWLDAPATNYGLVVVGPSPDGATFVSHEGAAAADRPRLDLVWQSNAPAPTAAALVAKGSTWKYLDTGVAPAATWRTVGFADTAWKQGPSELGYGDGDEKTVVGYGGNPAAKFITTWFRQSFTVADPKAFTSLLLACKRDDGVVLYLNGTEVMRSNMPAGTVVAGTLASQAIEDENYYKVLVDTSLLIAGTNVLAAEIHQANATSSDISFDATLDGETVAVPPGNCVPADCSDGNPCTTDTCSGTTCSHANNTLGCDDGDPCTSGDACLNGACSGSATVCNDNNPCTDDACSAATGCTYTPNSTCPVPTAVIAKGSTWKYLDTGVAPAATWRTVGFGDTAWKQGPSKLGYGYGDENTVVGYGGDPLAKFITTWFRQSFTVADPKAFVSLLLACKRDDGVVLYLNGTEVMRSNMPAGTVVASTLAATVIGTDNTFYTVPVDTGLLVAGTNVLAAEIHQARVTSSDISFDASLDGELVANNCVPADCSDGNPCTTDVCSGTTCSHNVNALACDDGNPCTSSDACLNGACTGSGTTCNDNDPCTDDGCNPVTGCTYTANTASCSDGNACTSGDACANSACVPGAAIGCDDGNPCTDDGCSAASGCTHANNALACDDGDACTAGDACLNGTCAGTGNACNDSNPCTDDNCDVNKVCTHTANTAPCNDANACTLGDACLGGVCLAGTATDCQDGNDCTASICDTDLGCLYQPVTGVPCNDGSVCTPVDECSGGICALKGKALNCNDNNPCTNDSCNALTGCAHANNTASCSDGNACTTGDTCGGGSCQPGTEQNCADTNVCTDDACNPATGCTHAFNTVPCSDGSSCTTGDACQGGVCKPAITVQCDDLNPCTTDTCDGVTGCTHTNNTLACDDGTACTSNDACLNGSCVGITLNCNDANACTADACNAVTGCSHTNVTATCSDLNGCTTVDACVSGACVGSSPKNCDDGNPCTLDTCSTVVATGAGKCANTPSATLDGLACPTGGGCSSAKCSAGACVSSGCAGETWPWTVPATFAPATKWFDPTGYHVAEITLAASDWAAYLADVASGVTNTWYKADVKLDGTTFSQVGIRAFGYGSMLSNPGKPNIRVQFAKFVPGETGPEGLSNVRFKASGQDPSFIREPIIYGMSRALGGAAPRSSFARVSINGVPYGFFIVLEHVDTDTFSAFWGNNTGHFYEQNNGCVGINCPAAGCSAVPLAYKLNGALGTELVTMATAINSGTAAGWVAQVAGVADLPSLLVFYAMDVLTSNVDGMTTAANNYDVYGDTASGKLFFIHHGMDLTLGGWSAWYDWTTPWGPPCSWCNRAHDDFYYRMLQTPALKQQMWDVFKAAHCGPFATATVNTLVDKMKALIGNDLYNDPKGKKTKAQIDADFQVLKTYMVDRNNSLNTLVGTSCP